VTFPFSVFFFFFLCVCVVDLYVKKPNLWIFFCRINWQVFAILCWLNISLFLSGTYFLLVVQRQQANTLTRCLTVLTEYI
jgi:hypothetical protein